MIDATIHPLDIQLGVQATADGSEPEQAQLTIVFGGILPGPSGPMAIPQGMIRIPLNKDSATQVGEGLLEAAKALRAPSKIDIATSLSGVDQAAQAAQNLRGE